MANLDYRTAGESHGQALVTLVEGLPAGLRIDQDAIGDALTRRQGGLGRGGRMAIERDEIQILSGVRNGITIGSPVAMQLVNKDWRIDQAPPVHRPRPGHADYAGAMKWLTTDCRSTLERASARETAARVAAGSVAACLLREFGIDVVGYVVQIGAVTATAPDDASPARLRADSGANDVYCPDSAAAPKMIAEIRTAERNKDTIGGIVEVRVFGLPPGIGSCSRWQDKLDGRLLAAVGSIQAIKGVEIGLGFGCAGRPGSQVHDEIAYRPDQRQSASLGFVRRSNNAGGLEGGMTNGMPVVLRAVMKPISTLVQGLDSVNLETLETERSDYERSDVCAVPSASVVAENVVAFEIARAFIEKFSGDTVREVQAAYEFYLASARRLTDPPEEPRASSLAAMRTDAGPDTEAGDRTE
ncbi:MAG: chorismate synthase [Phycisphaerae bacterium]|nr:chorismate synthase [Phycisphaerae bacterium]